MKEKEKDQTELWYEYLVDIASLDPKQRYHQLVRLHGETLDFYLPAIKAITPQKASRPGSDGRSVGLVVAHIMAWEEWQTQVFTNPHRSERLDQQMKLQRYFDPENNTFRDFKNVDDFNAYQTEKYKGWDWKDIQQKAINTALQLQSLFPSQPKDEWIDFLEQTPPHVWKLTPKTTITVPQGWYLWMVSLEHEAIEHKRDLL